MELSSQHTDSLKTITHITDIIAKVYVHVGSITCIGYVADRILKMMPCYIPNELLYHTCTVGATPTSVYKYCHCGRPRFVIINLKYE